MLSSKIKKRKTTTDDIKNYIGYVLIHTDTYGFHKAVILKEIENDFFALMLTTNPYWNKDSRQLSNDEKGLMGIVFNTKTYYAPVIRSKREFSLISDRKIDIKYVEEYIKEFANGL